MLLGPNLLDGTTAHQPLGWVDGEFARQGDGTVHYNWPDSSSLGSTTVQGLKDETEYALILPVQNPSDVEITELSLPGGPYTFTVDGMAVQTFTTVTTGCLLDFRASGNGQGIFGPVELREVIG